MIIGPTRAPGPQPDLDKRIETDTSMMALDSQGSERLVQARGHCRSLMLVGRRGFIPDCNILALEHQCPDLAVRHFANLAEPLIDAQGPPAVILIDEGNLATVVEVEAILKKFTRHRVIAVIDDATPSASPTIQGLVTQNLIRGVLPMNLRLELWLIAVDLFVRGGEFVPASLLQAQQPVTNERERRQSLSSLFSSTKVELTERELQVLEMVSAGCSNRGIAVRLRLSEHTIKVHVHNMIRKLKAPNRTAAAAIYLEGVQGAARPTEPPARAVHGEAE